MDPKAYQLRCRSLEVNQDKPSGRPFRSDPSKPPSSCELGSGAPARPLLGRLREIIFDTGVLALCSMLLLACEPKLSLVNKTPASLPITSPQSQSLPSDVRDKADALIVYTDRRRASANSIMVTVDGAGHSMTQSTADSNYWYYAIPRDQMCIAPQVQYYYEADTTLGPRTRGSAENPLTATYRGHQKIVWSQAPGITRDFVAFDSPASSWPEVSLSQAGHALSVTNLTQSPIFVYNVHTNNPAVFPLPNLRAAAASTSPTTGHPLNNCGDTLSFLADYTGAGGTQGELRISVSDGTSQIGTAVIKLRGLCTGECIDGEQQCSGFGGYQACQNCQWQPVTSCNRPVHWCAPNQGHSAVCSAVPSCPDGQSWCPRMNKCVPTCDPSKCESLSEDGTSCSSICGSGKVCRGVYRCCTRTQETCTPDGICVTSAPVCHDALVVERCW